MQIFSSSKGFIKYNEVKESYRHEFIEHSHLFWTKTKNWIYIDVIRVKEKFQGDGTILLTFWLEGLKNVGIVLNASPLDDDINQARLQEWYKKFGFKEIEDGNKSLYKIIN